MPKSLLELRLEAQMRAVKLPKWECQYKFCTDRRWRADFAWPEQKIICEVNGGIWTGGRHVRGKGYEADCEKLSFAAILGYRAILVTGRHIDEGLAIKWLESALNLK